MFSCCMELALSVSLTMEQTDKWSAVFGQDAAMMLASIQANGSAFNFQIAICWWGWLCTEKQGKILQTFP